VTTYSVLSATATLGIAAETETAVYVPPSFTVPFTSGTRFRDMITQLTDETRRGRDTDVEDIQQGHYHSDWTVTTEAYPDWAGWLFRAMIGPDRCTPGMVTTFAQPASPGATQFWLDAAPPAGAVLQLGSENTEYVQAGTPSGSGPYLVPVASPSSGLRYAHPAGDAAQSQATHLFQQDRTFATVWPSYSLTTDDGVDLLGWPGCILGRLRLQVAKDGYAKLVGSWNGWPPVTAATAAVPGSGAQPSGGWEWGITTAGGTSNRGISLDLSLTRALDVIVTGDGSQGPYLIAPGPMKASGAYKAIYDSPSDLDLYRQAIQEPAVWTLAQPLLQGGCFLEVALSLSGWTQGSVSLEEQYVTADFKLAGIANQADSPSYGVSSATLVNFWQQSY
jgi:Phage tail tube protein